MTVRIDMARWNGKYYVRIGHTSARVEEGRRHSAPRVVLKDRHLKILGITRYRREEYFLLNGKTLAHGKRDVGFVVVKDLPLPGFPADRHKDFEWSAEINVE